MITITNLSFAYKEEDFVLENINIQFQPSMVQGIVGLNGSGKTTFFNLLTGFYKADKGSILMNGLPIKKNCIAYIDTESFFYPKLTAKEFLKVFPQTNLQYDEEGLTKLFNLPLNEFIENYSTGMKKKLLILSQIKQDKQLYIFDEPFNGLDIETNKLLIVIIEMLAHKGKTIFISSHIIEPLYNLCFHIHHLQNKHFIKSYTKQEFSVIEEEVFGNYTNELKQHLKQIF